MKKMKPFYKTSEFWMAIGGITAILTQFVTKHCTITQTDVLALGGIIAAYIINRGWVKAKK